MIYKSVCGLAAVGLLAACDADLQSVNAPEAAAPATDAVAMTPMPFGLTPDERVIWNSLTEDARKAAAEFIANGGTLTQFVAT